MLRTFRSLPLLYQVCWVVVALLFSVVVWSAVSSGVHYQYDNDELSQAQYSYLIGSGYTPHHDFFLRYTPVFSWFLLPFFLAFGYQFSTIMLIRWAMVVLFLLRVGVSFRLVQLIFGVRVAVVFLLLFFLDPFTVFAAMQIRPDNLMMLVYMIGLLVLTLAWSRKSPLLSGSAGALLSISLLVLLKIVPSLFIICLGVGGWCLLQRRYRFLLSFCLGLVIPVLMFSLVMIAQGAFRDMAQQVLIDSATMNRYLLHPATALYFYQPIHLYLFGAQGISLLWTYTCLLLLSAVAGASFVLGKHRAFFPTVLSGAFLVQLLSIAVFPGAFIQYFVSVGWSLALFAGVAVVNVYDAASSKRILSWSLSLIGGVVFCLLAVFSIRANFFRASITSVTVQATYERLWRIIPDREPTFPNFLFRPLAYPLVYGTFIGDLPQEMINRFGSIPAALQQHHVRYMFMDSYSLTYVNTQTKTYLQTEYHATNEPNLYRKNE